MKIRACYLLMALMVFSLGGSVSAVEKKPKSTPPTQAPKTPPKSKDSQKVKPKKQPAPEKKFDDFVDKNKNGVDDRKEKPAK